MSGSSSGGLQQNRHVHLPALDNDNSKDPLLVVICPPPRHRFGLGLSYIFPDHVRLQAGSVRVDDEKALADMKRGNVTDAVGNMRPVTIAEPIMVDEAEPSSVFNDPDSTFDSTLLTSSFAIPSNTAKLEARLDGIKAKFCVDFDDTTSKIVETLANTDNNEFNLRNRLKELKTFFDKCNDWPEWEKNHKHNITKSGSVYLIFCRAVCDALSHIPRNSEALDIIERRTKSLKIPCTTESADLRKVNHNAEFQLILDLSDCLSYRYSLRGTRPTHNQDNPAFHFFQHFVKQSSILTTDVFSPTIYAKDPVTGKDTEEVIKAPTLVKDETRRNTVQRFHCMNYLDHIDRYFRVILLRYAFLRTEKELMTYKTETIRLRDDPYPRSVYCRFLFNLGNKLKKHLVYCIMQAFVDCALLPSIFLVRQCLTNYASRDNELNPRPVLKSRLMFSNADYYSLEVRTQAQLISFLDLHKCVKLCVPSMCYEVVDENVCTDTILLLIKAMNKRNEKSKTDDEKTLADAFTKRRSQLDPSQFTFSTSFTEIYTIQWNTWYVEWAESSGTKKEKDQQIKTYTNKAKKLPLWFFRWSAKLLIGFPLSFRQYDSLANQFKMQHIRDVIIRVLPAISMSWHALRLLFMYVYYWPLDKKNLMDKFVEVGGVLQPLKVEGVLPAISTKDRNDFMRNLHNMEAPTWMPWIFDRSHSGGYDTLRHVLPGSNEFTGFRFLSLCATILRFAQRHELWNAHKAYYINWWVCILLQILRQCPGNPFGDGGTLTGLYVDALDSFSLFSINSKGEDTWTYAQDAKDLIKQIADDLIGKKTELSLAFHNDVDRILTDSTTVQTEYAQFFVKMVDSMSHTSVYRTREDSDKQPCGKLALQFFKEHTDAILAQKETRLKKSVDSELKIFVETALYHMISARHKTTGDTKKWCWMCTDDLESALLFLIVTSCAMWCTLAYDNMKAIGLCDLSPNRYYGFPNGMIPKTIWNECRPIIIAIFQKASANSSLGMTNKVAQCLDEITNALINPRKVLSDLKIPVVVIKPDHTVMSWCVVDRLIGGGFVLSRRLDCSRF